MINVSLNNEKIDSVVTKLNSKLIFAFVVLLLHLLPFVVSDLIAAFWHRSENFISVSFAPSVASISMQAGVKKPIEKQIEKPIIKNNDKQTNSKFAKDNQQENQTKDKIGDGDVNSAASSEVQYNIGSINNPVPKYPAFARQNGYQGIVSICVDVNDRGEPTNAKICKSSGYGVLDNSALNTIKKWKFKINASFNGYRSVIVPINFVLS